ncbi:MAG: hypothetical protein IT510_08600 [Sulfuritalea sp.]|jgi:hypothetical protein|nr:hypothetical protein [Sulfuritalea sp.]
MNTLARALKILILCGTLANGSAMAGHRVHKHGHGHVHGPIVHFGFSYGFPVHLPLYFPAPVYSFPRYAFPAPVQVYPSAVIRHYPSPVYIEQSIAPLETAPPQAQHEWHYCADSRMYYPYVRDCPGGWQRVPVQPTSR